MFRTELRKKMVRPEQRGTECGDRQQTIQTATVRLGDLGGAKSGGRDIRPSTNGGIGESLRQQTAVTGRWAKRRNQRPSPNGGIGPPVRQQSVINGSVIKVEAQATVTQGV